MSKLPFASFETFQKQTHSRQPSWLKTASNLAAEKFLEMGLPDRRSEDWKYTDLGFINKFSGQIANATEFAGTSSTVFSKLSQQQISEWDNLRKNLNSWLTESAFENLNLALNTGGLFIKVNRGEIKTINYNLTSKESRSWNSPRAVIFLEENSSAVIFEESHLEDGEISNSVVDVQMAAGSKLTYIKLQNSKASAHNISTVRVSQKKDSHFKHMNFTFGAEVSRDNILCNLEEPGAECDLTGLSVAQPNQHLDQYVFVDHRAPNARSTQLFKNIVGNKARAVFNGRVMVREGSSGTDAKQLNRNLLLGNSAEIDTRPQLEIANDDVKCSHGATIGRLNAEEVFYLESRGIPSRMAVNMLCRAFVDEVVLLIPQEDIKIKIKSELDGHFSGLETDHVL